MYLCDVSESTCGTVTCIYMMFQSLLVGLLDADVYGPSIPKMMNLKGPVNITKREYYTMF